MSISTTGARLFLILIGVIGVVLHATATPPHPAQTLLIRATVLLTSEPDASKRHADAALALLKEQPDPELEVSLRLLLCDYFSERDQRAAAQQVASLRILLPHVARNGLRAGLFRCQGKLQEASGNTEQALALYEQAITHATTYREQLLLADALAARGYLRSTQGEFTLSLLDLRRAEELYLTASNSAHAVTTLNSIAVLYSRMGDNTQAIEIFKRALKVQRADSLHLQEAITLAQLAHAHQNLRHWQDALQAYQRSLQISRNLNYARGEATALLGLAAVANLQGDAEQALQLLDTAMPAREQAPDAILGAQMDLSRGTALRALNRYPASLVSLKHAIAIFKRSGTLADLGMAYAELAAVYGALGQWRIAFEQQVEAQSASEQLLKNQLDQRFTALKVEFDAASKEQENALLLRENQANAKALAAADQASQLQLAVIALAIVLASLLAGIAWHQRRTQLRMRQLALTDELTGAPNRRAILARLDPLLEGTTISACALLIVDIDHFKAINDRHGHSQGDAALQHVAIALQEAVREPAFLGRLGGEEFVIVLPNTNLMDAADAAERVRVQVMNMDASRWKDGKPITVSIGVTVSRPTGDTASDLLKRADAALYVAKNDGRNCVRTELAVD